MKKIISSIVLVFICLYGFSVNPVDTPAKTGDEAQPVILPLPSENSECSELLTLVPVTVIVTFTDCPDYDCQEPSNCYLEVCVYDPNITEPIGCQPWDPDQCQYTFEDLRATDGAYLNFKLRVTPTGCMTGYNSGVAYIFPQVTDGGTCYGSSTYCVH